MVSTGVGGGKKVVVPRDQKSVSRNLFVIQCISTRCFCYEKSTFMTHYTRTRCLVRVFLGQWYVDLNCEVASLTAVSA